MNILTFKATELHSSLWKSSFDSEIQGKNMRILDIMSVFLRSITFEDLSDEMNGKIQDFMQLLPILIKGVY